MANDELIGRRVIAPGKNVPLEIWTWAKLVALFRSDQPGLELLPVDATPTAPRQGRVVLFARESGAGSGKYQLCAMGPGEP